MNNTGRNAMQLKYSHGKCSTTLKAFTLTEVERFNELFPLINLTLLLLLPFNRV